MLKKRTGFTIIELLLVIAIIGVMAALGVSMFHKQAEAHKIQKTALQMQQLLQASMTYYSNENQWPTEGTTITPPTSFKPFIPIGNQQNPWAADSNGFEFFPTTNGYRFDVVTTLPNKKLAEQVAAQLPNATTGNACPQPASTPWQWHDSTVCAEVTIPGQDIPSGSGMTIGGIGTGADGSTATATCPPHTCAYFYASIQSVHTDAMTAFSELPNMAEPISYAQAYVNNCALQADNSVACKLHVDITKNDWHDNQVPNGLATATYIAVCKKPPQGQACPYNVL